MTIRDSGSDTDMDTDMDTDGEFNIEDPETVSPKSKREKSRGRKEPPREATLRERKHEPWLREKGGKRANPEAHGCEAQVHAKSKV